MLMVERRQLVEETDTEHSVLREGSVESCEITLLFITSTESSQQFAEGAREKTNLCGDPWLGWHSVEVHRGDWLHSWIRDFWKGEEWCGSEEDQVSKGVSTALGTFLLAMLLRDYGCFHSEGSLKINLRVSANSRISAHKIQKFIQAFLSHNGPSPWCLDSFYVMYMI